MTASGVHVAGAGITGLAAAWELTGGRPPGAPDVDVTVWEAEGRAGGKISASEVDGLRLDEGADAFLVRTPEASALCAEIGVTDLVHPSGLPAYVWIDGALRRIPRGLVLGAPADVDELEGSGILTPEGMERARRESVVTIDADDLSVGDLIDAHYGAEVTERLVGPLIGGISAGAVDRLSAASVTPQLFAAGTGDRPMAAELRELPQIDGPVFAAPHDGMATIIDRLVEELSVRGVRFEWNRTVGELSGSAHDSWIVTTPAHVAAPLIGVVSPDAGELLRGISFSSVVFVTVVVDRRQVAGPLDGSGFLVPRSAGLRLTAASWMSAKWPHLGLDDRVVIRASLGHIDDPEPITWTDETIIDTVVRDLDTTMGLSGAPRAHRIVRYPRAFPHYDVGHRRRMESVAAALAQDRPGVEVCGMAHEGVGIPACIRSGRTAADRLRSRLGRTRWT